MIMIHRLDPKKEWHFSLQRATKLLPEVSHIFSPYRSAECLHLLWTSLQTSSTGVAPHLSYTTPSGTLSHNGFLWFPTQPSPENQHQLPLQLQSQLIRRFMRCRTLLHPFLALLLLTTLNFATRIPRDFPRTMHQGWSSSIFRARKLADHIK